MEGEWRLRSPRIGLRDDGAHSTPRASVLRSVLVGDAAHSYVQEEGVKGLLGERAHGLRALFESREVLSKSRVRALEHNPITLPAFGRRGINFTPPEPGRTKCYGRAIFRSQIGEPQSIGAHISQAQLGKDLSIHDFNSARRASPVSCLGFSSGLRLGGLFK